MVCGWLNLQVQTDGYGGLTISYMQINPHCSRVNCGLFSNSAQLADPARPSTQARGRAPAKLSARAWPDSSRDRYTVVLSVGEVNPKLSDKDSFEKMLLPEFHMCTFWLWFIHGNQLGWLVVYTTNLLQTSISLKKNMLWVLPWSQSHWAKKTNEMAFPLSWHPDLLSPLTSHCHRFGLENGFRILTTTALPLPMTTSQGKTTAFVIIVTQNVRTIRRTGPRSK